MKKVVIGFNIFGKLCDICSCKSFRYNVSIDFIDY